MNSTIVMPSRFVTAASHQSRHAHTAPSKGAAGDRSEEHQRGEACEKAHKSEFMIATLWACARMGGLTGKMSGGGLHSVAWASVITLIELSVITLPHPPYCP